MKKLSPRQYAELLYELVVNARKAEIPDRVKKFLDILVRGRALAQVSRIIQVFQALVDVRSGIVRLRVTGARKIPHTVYATLLKTLKAKELAMEEYVDSDVIGGLKIEIGDRIIDGTVRKQLENMRLALAQ